MGRLQSVVNTQRLRDAEALLLVLLLLLHLLLELLHLPQVHLCAASVIFIYIATVQIARSQDVPLLKQSDCAQVRNSWVCHQKRESQCSTVNTETVVQIPIPH
jgi:hypothetical protein